MKSSGMRGRAAMLGPALAALVLFVAWPAAGAKVRPPMNTTAAADPATAPGVPSPVFLTSFEGQPADSVAALAFATGFQGAFLDEYFLTEAVTKDPSRPASPVLTNRFRLVRGDAFGDEWQLQVTVMDWWGAGAQAPTPADTTAARAPRPGLRVNVAVLPAAAAGARPVPAREDLTFETPLEPSREYYMQAGRMVALLALESLHRRSGDLDDRTRLRLDRTVRAPVITPGAPTPSR
jgi:hypothetical protein